MARIPIHLTPSAGRDAIEGWRDGTLRVRVKAPHEDGKANAALVRLIARATGDTGVRIVAGATLRRKIVECPGLSDSEVAGVFGEP